MSGGARDFLRTHNVLPKKSFGQNFLTDATVTESIAEITVKGEAKARVTELGAGTGELTSALLARGATVLAIERDRDLMPLLEKRFEQEIAAGRLRVVEGDAKTAPWVEEGDGGVPRILVGNLPYQITGPLLERATHEVAQFSRVVFMVQEEVADRLRAKPSTKAYGALSVFAQAAFVVEKVRRVGQSSFFPPPRVGSAVVRLTPRVPPIEETDALRAVVHGAFGERRKTLRNAWSRTLGEHAAAVAEAAGVSLDARGETLGPEEFARVADAWSRLRSPP